MNAQGVDLGKATLKDTTYLRLVNDKESILAVDARSPQVLRNRVRKVLEVVNRELGALDITDEVLWGSLAKRFGEKRAPSRKMARRGGAGGKGEGWARKIASRLSCIWSMSGVWGFAWRRGFIVRPRCFRLRAPLLRTRRGLRFLRQTPSLSLHVLPMMRCAAPPSRSAPPRTRHCWGYRGSGRPRAIGEKGSRGRCWIRCVHSANRRRVAGFWRKLVLVSTGGRMRVRIEGKGKAGGACMSRGNDEPIAMF